MFFHGLSLGLTSAADEHHHYNKEFGAPISMAEASNYLLWPAAACREQGHSYAHTADQDKELLARQVRGLVQK